MCVCGGGGQEEAPMERGQSSEELPTLEDVPTRGVIKIIAGGPTDNDSNRVRKSHARLMESRY